MVKRITAYGVGGAVIPLAPQAVKSNGVPDNSSVKYILGQMVLNTAANEWLIYNGEQDEYTVIGGGGIETVNTIAPDIAHNFTIAAGAGITITPGTNEITLSSSGGGAGVDTFVTELNTPCVPNGSGEINTTSSTSTFTDAVVPNSNILNIEVQAPDHNILVGKGGNVVVGSIAPSAASGIPLVSNGVAADPSYSTAEVVGGGTGLVSTAPYAVLAGGTSSTNPLQQVSGLGTSGQVLTSTGALSLPTWQTSPVDPDSVESITTNLNTPCKPNISGVIATNISTTTFTDAIASNANTLKIEVQGTNHAVFVGSGSNIAATTISPTASIGIPLVSNGVSANPSFSTAEVVGGGTGLVSTAPYAVLAGGTSSTNPLQQVSGLGTSGQVLTSNGAAMLPTWQAGGGGSGFSSIVTQTFAASGTYTPTAAMKYCMIEVVGAGGAGGGSTVSGAGDTCVGGGGGGGGYARGSFSAATIGVSQVVTIGAGGIGASGAAGGTGGTTSVGALISATGGVGGNEAGPATFALASSGAGGAGASGDFQCQGCPGSFGFGLVSAGAGISMSIVGGQGGSSFFGGGAVSIVNNAGAFNGNAATSHGGGGGGSTTGSAAAATGGNGANGLVVVTEFI